MRTEARGRLRLLVLTSTWPRSGWHAGPVFVRELTVRLADQFDVLVLVPHAPGLPSRETDGPLTIVRYRYAPERLEQLAYASGIGPQLRERRWRWLLVPSFLLCQMWAIRRIGARFRPDLIHAHWLIPQGLAAAFAGLAVPLACTCHGIDITGFNGRLALALKRRAALACDAVALVSRHLAGLYAQRVPGGPPARVLSMGVDLQRHFVPDPDGVREPQRLLFVGRLIDVKGLAVLLQAVARLAAARPVLTLEVVGDGPLRAALEAETLGLGIDDRVRFHGRLGQDALPAFYRRCAACVVPSIRTADGHEEALGLVAIEAMGCGCPVIGSDLPGMRDVLAHERNALVVPAGDSRALAAAIDRLLDDAPLAARLAERARVEALERFDWAPVARAHAQWLQALAGPRRG